MKTYYANYNQFCEQNYKEACGKIFDAINANGGSGLDKGKVASYLTVLDMQDNHDGKIGYSAFSSYNDKLATGDLKQKMSSNYENNIRILRPFLGEYKND